MGPRPAAAKSEGAKSQYADFKVIGTSSILHNSAPDPGLSPWSSTGPSMTRLVSLPL